MTTLPALMLLSATAPRAQIVHKMDYTETLTAGRAVGLLHAE